MMILIIIVIAIICFVCIGTDVDDECTGCFGACLLFSIIVTGFLIGGIVNGRVIDQKIAMYTEENEKIEMQMDELVTQYMEYESSAYGELKGESGITLISLYPELKADTLVSKQIEIYTENNQKIKELKEKAINISNYKWWVYFGK